MAGETLGLATSGQHLLCFSVSAYPGLPREDLLCYRGCSRVSSGDSARSSSARNKASRSKGRGRLYTYITGKCACK